MQGKTEITRLRLPAVLLALLGALVVTGCGPASKGVEGDAATPQPAPPMATPTVDMMHAREAFEAGGELTYEEVIALVPEIVGDPPERVYTTDGEGRLLYDNYDQAQADFVARREEFYTQLKRCRLRETIGWVGMGARASTRAEAYKNIPDKNLLYIYVYDPFYGFGKELHDDAEILLFDFTDEEVAQLKYGQRIMFSGDFLDGHVSVKRFKYTLMEDEPAVPASTADELEDMQIILIRTMCDGGLGECPAYTLTIGSDGNVMFDGKHKTQTKGKATAKISSEKLVELATEIKKADFFSLEDSYYYTGLHHAPTYRLTVRMNGRSKQVESYATRPRRLELLMNRIDQIVDIEQWIGDVWKW